MTGILAVYGLKTRDYGYLARFYPAARLKAACENRSLKLRFLFPHDVPVFLATPPESDLTSSGLPSKDEFPPGTTVCLVRGRVPGETIRLLEDAGYRCVNSATATETANDKIETAHVLDGLAIPTPRAAVSATLEDTFGESDYPLIAKPRHGSRGDLVRLVATVGEARSLSRDSRPGDDEWLFQEYVAASCGRDLRVFFAGNRIVAVVERFAPAGTLVSNASSGGEMRLARFGSDALEPWIAATRAVARKIGLRYGTVDFLFRSHPGDPDTFPQSPLDLTVCEVNAAPGFEALERTTGIDVAGLLVEDLVGSLPE